MMQILKKGEAKMKARLIMTTNDGVKKYFILCTNGTIATASAFNLKAFLTSFNSIESITGDENNRWDTVAMDMGAYAGTTCAYITDNYLLCISDFGPFSVLMTEVPVNWSDTDFLTTKEYAMKHNKSVETIKVHCKNGRIAGAKKTGGVWFIPVNAPYPRDGRYREN